MKKEMRLRLILFLILISTATAQEVKISAGIFLGIINEDGEGPYQLILKEAARRSGLILSERPLPLRRALNEFIDKKALAIYGMTSAVIEEVGEDAILTTYPLGAYKLFLFTRRGEPAVSCYDRLEGKTVGGIIGYEAYYRELEDRGIAIDYMANEENLMKTLESHRVDVILGFLPDWIPFLNLLSYDPGFPVHIGYDYMTVWKSEEGEDFVRKISPALEEMKQDGTFKRILGDRYMEFQYEAVETYEWRSHR